jgi:hypothetical protein
LHRHIDVISAQEDSDREMWSMYVVEVKEHDERITGTWKEDAAALVVFVGPNLSILPSAIMTTEDRAFRCSRCRFHYRKLQKVVP